MAGEICEMSENDMRLVERERGEEREWGRGRSLWKMDQVQCRRYQAYVLVELKSTAWWYYNETKKTHTSIHWKIISFIHLNRTISMFSYNQYTHTTTNISICLLYAIYYKQSKQSYNVNVIYLTCNRYTYFESKTKIYEVDQIRWQYSQMSKTYGDFRRISLF